MYNINIIKVKELTLKVLKLKFWRLINMKISEVFSKLNEEQKEVIKQLSIRKSYIKNKRYHGDNQSRNKSSVEIP